MTEPVELQPRTAPPRSDEVLPPKLDRKHPANENRKTALDLDYVARWLLLL
jgi:hypothetical protein